MGPAEQRDCPDFEGAYGYVCRKFLGAVSIFLLGGSFGYIDVVVAVAVSLFRAPSFPRFSPLKRHRPIHDRT